MNALSATRRNGRKEPPEIAAEKIAVDLDRDRPLTWRVAHLVKIPRDTGLAERLILLGIGNDYVSSKPVAVAFVSLMKGRWICGMEEDVVFHHAVVSFPQLDPYSNTKIAVDQTESSATTWDSVRWSACDSYPNAHCLRPQP